MSSSCGNPDCLNRLNFLPDPPVSEKFRNYEQLALRIRFFAGLSDIHDKLDPYLLAQSAGLRVVPFEAIDGLTESVKAVLRSPDGAWSGGATPMLPDGTRVVILNPSHSSSRKAATLMEEVCHVLLGHKHSQLSAGGLDADQAGPAAAVNTTKTAVIPQKRRMLASEIFILAPARCVPPDSSPAAALTQSFDSAVQHRFAGQTSYNRPSGNPVPGLSANKIHRRAPQGTSPGVSIWRHCEAGHA